MTTPTRNHILVVDDDPRLNELLKRYLTEQGFDVQIAFNGKEMDAQLDRQQPDLMVLDLMLPGEDGLAICKRLRQAGNQIPVLMLTARGDEEDRIRGLELGADDYLPKPFNPRELIARIQAILRRHGGAPAATGEDQVIRFGDYMLNLSQRTLTLDGKEIGLTNGEFELLSTLATRANHPLSREQLIELSNNRDSDAFDRSIDVRISRLRRLIEPDPGKPRYIQTVWGFGYKFVP